MVVVVRVGTGGSGARVLVLVGWRLLNREFPSPRWRRRMGVQHRIPGMRTSCVQFVGGVTLPVGDTCETELMGDGFGRVKGIIGGEAST